MSPFSFEVMFPFILPQAEYAKALEEEGENGQFSVSQAEKSKKDALLDSQLDIKVRVFF